ncbi:Golgi reassembly-stacking protein 2-like isoform X2 [Leptotrombidium deliense]|uniref:Golgi reassembly-stacking protein 2-like isoform X2 n=1 Tax=Leptotrombidium deliense TaxID=299467 RepID=A0A443SAV3_9ACAR|nr:Golgi reassembly-stacking protein 2-like isoform X2 [Leptotrombidium deliense]
MGGSQSCEVPGGGTEGYHVLRVQEDSPGAKAGLQAYFDFIIAIGNTRLNQDNDALKEVLKASIDRPIKVTVYNSKTQTVRETEIVPSNTWGGQGLLGVSIRFCSFEGANEHVWHVLEVEPNSPAEIAGLQSNCDYIIGADSVLQESEDLFSLIEAHEGKPLKVFVYNLLTDCCREVTITPNSNWGGEGSLGCGIGYGYLHRIPKRPFDEVPVVSKPATRTISDHSLNASQSQTTNVNEVANKLSNVEIGGDRYERSEAPVYQPQATTAAASPPQVENVAPQMPPYYAMNTTLNTNIQSNSAIDTSSTGTFVTPLTIPGMPPITVSASLPSELSISSLGINFQNPPQPPVSNAAQPQYSWQPQQPYNYQMPVSTYGQPVPSAINVQTPTSVPNSKV